MLPTSGPLTNIFTLAVFMLRLFDDAKQLCRSALLTHRPKVLG